MVVPITFQAIRSDTLEALEGVEISVWSETYDTYLGGGTTDSSGVFVLGLDEGTYKVFFLKNGYTFYPLPKTLGVETNPLDIEFKGTPVEIPPIPSGLVYLHGTISKLSLNPSPLPVYVHLNGTPQTKNEAVLDRTTMTVCTNYDGNWGVLLAGGVRVTVSIPGCKFQKTGILPFGGSINVIDLGLYG
jgi:hypothetical protein